MFWLLSRLFFLVLLVALLVPLALLVAAVQREPLVAAGAAPTAESVSRAKTLLRQYDPRGRPGGELRTLEAPERDLTFLLDYAVGQLLPASAAVDLHNGGATVSLTAVLPQNPLGRYFNLQAELSQIPGGVEIEGLRFGSVALPQIAARGVGWLAREAAARSDAVATLLGSVNGYKVTEDRLVIVYQWQPGLLDRVKSQGRALLVDAADRERLLAYAAAIAAASREAASVAGKTPLPELLAPVFDAARARTGSKGDAAAENRAAIVAVMLYLQGVDVPRLLDEPGDVRNRGKARAVTLRGRRDLAQHFLISAGITAAGGSRLANAAGLFKELDDSRSGSGFSFTDLAADRAGVRFAEAATGPAGARVQSLMADKPREAQFMPEVRDLPEFMPEPEFVRRFGGVGTERYREVVEEIERRISALDMHAGLR